MEDQSVDEKIILKLAKERICWIVDWIYFLWIEGKAEPGSVKGHTICVVAERLHCMGLVSYKWAFTESTVAWLIYCTCICTHVLNVALILECYSASVRLSTEVRDRFMEPIRVNGSTGQRSVFRARLHCLLPSISYIEPFA